MDIPHIKWAFLDLRKDLKTGKSYSTSMGTEESLHSSIGNQ